MSEPGPRTPRVILSLVTLVLFVAAALTSSLLWWLGDWENHGFGLTLTLRILWGCFGVAFLAMVLTRATIFGWYFRRYLRPPPEEKSPAARPLAGTIPRPARAPWYKSGVASFSTTVILVSLTGAAAVALAVLWVLEEVVGSWVFWLVFKSIVGAWWVLVISVVLLRVYIFGTHKKRGGPGDNNGPPPPEPTPPPPAPGAARSGPPGPPDAAPEGTRIAQRGGAGPETGPASPGEPAAVAGN